MMCEEETCECNIYMEEEEMCMNCQEGIKTSHKEKS